MYFLIISNDVHCRTFFVRNLTIRGQLAVGASSVLEARNLVNYMTPSCIILCQHPRLDDRIIRQIREKEALDGLPVVAVSEERPDRSWLAQWNVEIYLQSPVSVPVMLNALSPWLASVSQDQGVNHE